MVEIPTELRRAVWQTIRPSFVGWPRSSSNSNPQGLSFVTPTANGGMQGTITVCLDAAAFESMLCTLHERPESRPIAQGPSPRSLSLRSDGTIRTHLTAICATRLPHQQSARARPCVPLCTRSLRLPWRSFMHKRASFRNTTSVLAASTKPATCLIQSITTRPATHFSVALRALSQSDFRYSADFLTSDVE